MRLSMCYVSVYEVFVCGVFVSVCVLSMGACVLYLCACLCLFVCVCCVHQGPSICVHMSHCFCSTSLKKSTHSWSIVLLFNNHILFCLAYILLSLFHLNKSS